MFLTTWLKIQHVSNAFMVVSSSSQHHWKSAEISTKRAERWILSWHVSKLRDFLRKLIRKLCGEALKNHKIWNDTEIIWDDTVDLEKLAQKMSTKYIVFACKDLLWYSQERAFAKQKTTWHPWNARMVTWSVPYVEPPVLRGLRISRPRACWVKRTTVSCAEAHSKCLEPLGVLRHIKIDDLSEIIWHFSSQIW